LNKYIKEKEFINTIKSNDDFVCAYTLEEEINTVWIIIKEAVFKFKKKYLQSAREFREENLYNFNVVIFDEEQLDEIKEQLKYIGKYQYIEKSL